MFCFSILVCCNKGQRTAIFIIDGANYLHIELILLLIYTGHAILDIDCRLHASKAVFLLTDTIVELLTYIYADEIFYNGYRFTTFMTPVFISEY